MLKNILANSICNCTDSLFFYLTSDRYIFSLEMVPDSVYPPHYCTALKDSLIKIQATNLLQCKVNLQVHFSSPAVLKGSYLSGDIFGCHKSGWWQWCYWHLLGRDQETGVLLNILQCIGHSPTTKNSAASNLDNAKAVRSCSILGQVPILLFS